VNRIEREGGIGVGFICELGKVGGLFAKASTRMSSSPCGPSSRAGLAWVGRSSCAHAWRPRSR
jgi:hypothetical protein